MISMHDPASQELRIRNDWLLNFFDDTGHEAFAGNQPYYAVGGCAVLGGHYEAIKQEWREVRKLVNGSPDAPLHASELRQTPENLAAVSRFFGTPGIARIGVAATSRTTFHVDMHTMAPVMGMLKKQIARVAARVPCTTVAVIFESSQRADPLLMRHFDELQLSDDGVQLPTEHCLMPKSAGEPGLEIADFIVNAVGTQARRHLRGTAGFSQDFQAVFHQLTPPYAQFLLITDVGGSAEGHEAYVQAIGPKGQN